MEATRRRIGAVTVSPFFFPQFLGDLLYFSPNPEQVATPELSDLFFRVTAPHQFQRDIECFGRTVPTVNPTKFQRGQSQ